MEKISLFGELLYNGFVIEKCRCKSTGFWKIGYKNTLMLHLKILKKLTECLLVADICGHDLDVLCEFAQICLDNPKIGKYHAITPEIFEKMINKDASLLVHVDDKNDDKINQLIICLIDDALFYLNEKWLVNKKKIYMTMRALHNLPACYLKHGQSVNGSYRKRISKEIALAASFNTLNMDDEMRAKYKHIYECK